MCCDHQAIRYFRDRWFELYIHIQSLIALCDEQLGDWVHYLSTALRVLDPALQRCAIIAMQPHGTPVCRRERNVAAALRLAEFVESVPRVARGPLRKRHTRDLEPMVSVSTSIRVAQHNVEQRVLPGTSHSVVAGAVGEVMTISVYAMNHLTAPLVVDSVSVEVVPCAGSSRSGRCTAPLPHSGRARTGDLTTKATALVAKAGSPTPLGCSTGAALGPPKGNCVTGTNLI